LIIAWPGTPLDRALWFCWVVMFVVLETMGIVRKWGSTSLTRLTLAIVPKWILAMGLGWICYHFLIQYGK
jgi:hypothetical protein